LLKIHNQLPNPTLTTLRYFREEYDNLISGKKPNLSTAKKESSDNGNQENSDKPDINYYFITDKCIGCNICSQNCPVSVISGDMKKLHVIDQEGCIGCGSCYNHCPVHAIIFNEDNLKKDGKVIPNK